MGKVYLRKVKNGNCNGCYFFDMITPCNDMRAIKHVKHISCVNVIFKKISEKHAKKLLKSGKCKIVQQ